LEISTETKLVKWDVLKSVCEIAPLAAYLNAIPTNITIRVDDILAILVSEKQRIFSSKMLTNSIGTVHTGAGENSVNWIRTDSLFVTVLSKEQPANGIPTKLLEALEAWNPVPHQLIMSSMRHQLASQGMMAASKVLLNRHLQAGWLAEVLEKDDAIRKTNVRRNVARHWESLGDKIENAVIDFSERLANFLITNSTSLANFDTTNAHNDEENIHLQLNAYACSKPVEGHHLFTGHVLRLCNGKNNSQYWLCLTPACDLEPGQGADKGWKKRVSPWLPFKAVRLYPVHNKTALKEATRGYHLFVNENDQITTYGFAETVGNSGAPTLVWEQFFAEDQGKFAEGMKLTVACIGKKGDLEIDRKSAQVFAQLRYEYALNLVHRLGVHLSRVGLDFKNYSPAVANPTETVPELISFHTSIFPQ
jgi:hypothetical protein